MVLADYLPDKNLLLWSAARQLLRLICDNGKLIIRFLFFHFSLCICFAERSYNFVLHLGKKLVCNYTVVLFSCLIEQAE